MSGLGPVSGGSSLPRSSNSLPHGVQPSATPNASSPKPGLDSQNLPPQSASVLGSQRQHVLGSGKSSLTSVGSGVAKIKPRANTKQRQNVSLRKPRFKFPSFSLPKLFSRNQNRSLKVTTGMSLKKKLGIGLGITSAAGIGAYGIASAAVGSAVTNAALAVGVAKVVGLVGVTAGLMATPVGLGVMAGLSLIGIGLGIRAVVNFMRNR